MYGPSPQVLQMLPDYTLVLPVVTSSTSHSQRTKRSSPSVQGSPDVENRNRAGSGRRSSSTTEINTVRIEEMIQNDLRVTARNLVTAGTDLWRERAFYLYMGGFSFVPGVSKVAPIHMQKYPSETAPNALTTTLSVKRFHDTGSVADRKRSGRASIVKTKVADMETALQRSPLERPSVNISIIMEFISLLKVLNGMLDCSKTAQRVTHEIQFYTPTFKTKQLIPRNRNVSIT
ncbi:DUF4817 domain-containing protein [Trichonephila clavipes]|uniref:DUF4817 domain-containing protein n=1 Tax=Trichonephila clavipes TaxID=2585209 RepID=A0A8X6V532_TRICX|nr:DUF4817 domain-containing protein [Trichonephila clavipes]